ncbi:MAG: ribonuclease J [Pelagibacteraceae bacterium]
MKSINEVLFCPLGGSGEIGANMNLYGFGQTNNHKWLIVDCGITFAEENIPGVDIIIPDPEFIYQNKSNCLGIVITHGHEDHIGAITYIWPNLKTNIYATPFTGALIKEKFKEKKINIDDYLKIIKLNGSIDLNPIKINLISLTHSILEPNALLIEYDGKKIFHTGDWKCDLDPMMGDNINEQKLKEIGDQGILAMICDSTNIFTEGRSGSERDVNESMLRIFEKQKNRIIVTTFASNAARMQTVFQCAEKVGRHVSLVGRSMHRIFNTAKACGYFSNIKPPLDPRDVKKIPKEKIVYLCTGSQGEPRGAMNKICNQDHPDVEISPNDTVIFSSRIIPGNEKKLYAMHNLLVRRGINVISEENAFIHVSGHPGREEMNEMYNWIRPEISVPVHGEHRHLKEHNTFAKEKQIKQPVLIENGDVLKIFPGKSEIINKVNSGKLLVDGNRLVDEESAALRDRKNISFNGLMDISLIISKNGNIERSPIFNIKGLPISDHELNEIKYELEDKIFDICRSYSLNNKKQEINLIDNLKKSLRKIINLRVSKKPYTNINLIRV